MGFTTGDYSEIPRIYFVDHSMLQQVQIMTNKGPQTSYVDKRGGGEFTNCLRGGGIGITKCLCLSTKFLVGKRGLLKLPKFCLRSLCMVPKNNKKTIMINKTNNRIFTSKRLHFTLRSFRSDNSQFVKWTQKSKSHLPFSNQRR